MKTVIEFLEKSEIQYLATIGIDGKPKVRPFQFMFAENGKLWFCSSNQKEVYRELQIQPYIELCASGENMQWLRLSGTFIFEDNLRIKEKVLEISPLVKGIYKDANNPAFEVLFLADATAYISSIGKPPQIIKL